MVSTRYSNGFRHILEAECCPRAMQCGSTAVGVTRAERGPVPPSGSGQCRSQGESRVYLHTQIFVISTRHRGLWWGDHESVLRNEDLCSLTLYEWTECTVHVIILQSSVTYNNTRVVHSLYEYTVISIKSTFHIITLEWCTVHIRIPDNTVQYNI